MSRFGLPMVQKDQSVDEVERREQRLEAGRGGWFQRVRRLRDIRHCGLNDVGKGLDRRDLT
jgi:hypothetical protein